MKKLWFLLAMMILLAACGHKEAPPVTLANPVSSSSLQAMEEETGCPGESFRQLQDLSVRRYNVEPVLYELEFTGEDGLQYTLRLTKSTQQPDISGMYFNWTETVEAEDYSLYLDGQGHGICLWQRGEYAFSLALEEEATVRTLLEGWQKVQ